MYVAGIDIGSLASKAMIINEDKEIVSYTLIRSRPKSELSALEVMRFCLEKARLSMDNISYIVATGYGRISVPFANEKITEILCHARGVHWLLPSVRTIIDIGGQDTKGILIDKDAKVLNFVMNDKCAAGTGRFLEVMASALEVGISELGELAFSARERSKISSVCTVFAESEIISLMAEGAPKDSICAGLCDSIATRIYRMLLRIRIEPDICMTGGGSKNVAIVRMMEGKIGSNVVVPAEPQSTGALGAALTALRKLDSKPVGEV